MNDEQVKEALRALALTVVRNEIVTEDFLVELGIPRPEIGAAHRDAEVHLKTNQSYAVHWQSRFPELFA
jgi:hypothetical protein